MHSSAYSKDINNIFLLLGTALFYYFLLLYSLTAHYSFSSLCLELMQNLGRYFSRNPSKKVLDYIYTHEVTCELHQSLFSSLEYCGFLWFCRMTDPKPTSLLTTCISGDILHTQSHHLLSHQHLLTGWPIRGGGNIAQIFAICFLAVLDFLQHFLDGCFCSVL